MDQSTIPFKVATANLNQTVVNFTRNVPLIKAAIDKAAQDGADFLSLQELGLTGYTADDYFLWIRSEEQQQEILEMVKHIAEYAAEKNPNLIVSLGFPLWYADKSQPVKINVGSDEKPVMVPNPVYNIKNRPFNAQGFLQGGTLHGVSLKSIQPDGAAEYEPRQFTSWSDYLPVQEFDLPFFGKVPAGNVVMQVRGKDGKAVNLYHEICAEGWPGILDNGQVNEKEAAEGRFLSQVADKHDLSLVINPSASKPEPYLDKVSLRSTLAKLGSTVSKGAAYIYTNCLGLEAAPAAFEGGSIFVENGEVTHQSRRYSMADVEYASSVMALKAVDPSKAADATIEGFDFKAHALGAKVGGADPFENKKGFDREAEESVRNIALWMRDYLKKTGLQGFVISLSGGADSAFGAVMISQAIDLNIKQLEEVSASKEEAVARFINQFQSLSYREEALAKIEREGADAAIDFIKHNMLTCIYLPSDNSGVTTRDAAQCLIEGGTYATVEKDGQHVTMVCNEQFGDTIKDGVLHKIEKDGSEHSYTIIGEPVIAKGIGGKFEIINVQATVDSLIEAFVGMVHKDLLGKTVTYGGKSMSLYERVKQEIREYVVNERQEFSPAVLMELKHPERALAWPDAANPRVKDSENDITLQNIQARARLPYPWMVGNQEHKIACVTSNWSEAVAGYWTFGGDGHMGAINPCGGVPKSKLRHMLHHLETKGLEGMEPVTALNPVNVQAPTAELRPAAEGQTDEEDLMPYKMLDAIGEAIFFEKKSPLEAYESLKTAKDPDNETGLLFGTRENPAELDAKYLVQCIDKACKMWHRSQFKRVAAVVAPFMGQNVDPHTSIRTTILSDGFQTSLAQLKLRYVEDTLGKEWFAEHTGKTLSEWNLRARINEQTRDAITWSAPDALADKLAAAKEELWSKRLDETNIASIHVGAGVGSKAA